MDLRLRPLRADDELAVRAAQQALAAEGFEFAIDLAPDTDWAGYLAMLAAQHGGNAAADRVPATYLLAEVDGALVGRASIRHELNDWLLAHGGHIGYAVLPDHRRRGYASEILRQSLVVARAHGVDRALLTCDDDNLGSIAVIEAGGGKLDDAWPLSGPLTPDARPRRRYWID